MQYLPVERVEVSVEERGGGDAEAEQDGAGEVEGGVEAGGARVELDEANPRIASLLLLRAGVLTHIVCNVDIKLFFSQHLFVAVVGQAFPTLAAATNTSHPK